MKITIAKISTSGKSACGMIKTSEFSMMLEPVYIPNMDYVKGQVIEVPDTLKIVEWGDRKTKDGKPLKTLALR